MDKVYLAIDLKSFYASVECVARGLNPLTTHLVVADVARTEKTICLAVTPSLKKYGIPGRERLFRVLQQVEQINLERKKKNSISSFTGSSIDEEELKKNPSLKLSIITATPRMAYYMDISTQIYQIYLKYCAAEDIHVYSIDEVFIDATEYIKLYQMSSVQFARMLVNEIYQKTGITATAGIGTNLYLAKIAMDIVAKHMNPDANGVRMAYLDEHLYKKLLWTHQPLQDFWRIGRGIAKKLENLGIQTMGDLAVFSLHHEDRLFKVFGVNAELLIDHAWGEETTTMKDIKAYRPEHKSLGTGISLSYAYDAHKALIVVKEMMDSLSLELVRKGLVTKRIVLVVGYDNNIIDDNEDKLLKSAHGQVKLKNYTSSTQILVRQISHLYQRIIEKQRFIRRIYITACEVILETQIPHHLGYEQLNIFEDYDLKSQKEQKEKVFLSKEKKNQEVILRIKQKYGKNAILKAIDLEDGATTQERNHEIGGHKA